MTLPIQEIVFQGSRSPASTNKKNCFNNFTTTTPCLCSYATSQVVSTSPSYPYSLRPRGGKTSTGQRASSGYSSSAYYYRNRSVSPINRVIAPRVCRSSTSYNLNLNGNLSVTVGGKVVSGHSSTLRSPVSRVTATLSTIPVPATISAVNRIDMNPVNTSRSSSTVTTNISTL